MLTRKPLRWAVLLLSSWVTGAGALTPPAADDTSSRVNDATVFIAPGGTGTLISKRLVLTAGHVLPTHTFTQNEDWNTSSPRFRPLTAMSSWKRVADPCCKAAYRDGGAIDNRNIPGWDYRSVRGAAAATASFCRAECSADSECEAWVIVKPGDPKEGCYLKQASVTVVFGADRLNPTHVAKATRWSNAGNDDIAVLRLDQPVPPRIATPARVLTQLPPNEGVALLFLQLREYVMVGFGGGAIVRRRATGSFDRRGCSTGDGIILPNMTCLSSPADSQGGDSGGPAYLQWEGKQYVIGALQGDSPFGTGARYVEAYGTGGKDSTGDLHPNVSQWLDRLLSAAYLDDQPSDQPRSIPLYRWYGAERGDYFTTSSPAWGMQPRGAVPSVKGDTIINGPRRAGYEMQRLEGYVFSPHQSQPEGTVPLFSWFSPERGDNLISSAPAWTIPLADVQWGGRDGEALTNDVTRNGYTVFRLEGFVSDPKGPIPKAGAGIFSWYNPAVADNFATTHGDYSMPPSSIQWAGGTIANPPPSKDGYSMFRMEGYATRR